MELSPKEKAKELVERFKNDTVIYTWDNNGYEVDKETSLQNAKNCALIYVKGMRDMAESIWEKMDDYHTVEYWDKIKQKINKL